MNILLLLAHSIEEHDQIKLLSELGYDVFSIGGYIDPAHPHDPKRPALPDAPFHPELKAIVDNLGTDDNLRAAKDRIPADIIDWADAIIVHHYEHQWIVGNWPRIKHKRVIWRTVGQSVEANERLMAPLRKDGLQIVRYSPKERNIPGFVGEDALIRFYKDPDEWYGWTGEAPIVINFTQHLAQREPYTNHGFWQDATRGLPAIPLGPGSEAIRGPGEIGFDAPLAGAMPVISVPSNPDGTDADGVRHVSYDVNFPNTMKGWLRAARCYLYTGTQPASYTLGLIEAMMTGIPVVSIGPEWMRIFPYGPDLFEGHEIAGGYNDPAAARSALQMYLDRPEIAEADSIAFRQRAIELFGKDTIGRQWQEFLDAGVVDVERRLAGTAA